MGYYRLKAEQVTVSFEANIPYRQLETFELMQQNGTSFFLIEDEYMEECSDETDSCCLQFEPEKRRKR